MLKELGMTPLEVIEDSEDMVNSFQNGRRYQKLLDEGASLCDLKTITGLEMDQITFDLKVYNHVPRKNSR